MVNDYGTSIIYLTWTIDQWFWNILYISNMDYWSMIMEHPLYIWHGLLINDFGTSCIYLTWTIDQWFWIIFCIYLTLAIDQWFWNILYISNIGYWWMIWEHPIYVYLTFLINDEQSTNDQSINLLLSNILDLSSGELSSSSSRET